MASRTITVPTRYSDIYDRFAPIETETSVVEEFARSVSAQRKRRTSSKSIGGRDPSLRWPHLYEILLKKGYSKEKAAMISNSRRHLRKKGRLILKSERHKVTASAESLSTAQAWMENFHGNHNQKSHGRRGSGRYEGTHSKGLTYSKMGAGPRSTYNQLKKGGMSSEDALDETKRQLDARLDKAYGITPKRDKFKEIGAEGMRGDSRPVSSAEFQKLANEGQDQLDRMAGNRAPAKGLDDNMDAIKASGFDQVQSEWGGNTYNAQTGVPATEGLALTIKDMGVSTVSIPIGSDKATFDAAMDTARERFDSILQREGSHLGVFRDDDVGRIDFDPVLVVQTIREVETIGAATMAIGGAYEFSSGDGRWPPHVKGS